jgi:hypothetical protein
LNTPERTSNAPQFTDEQIDKASAFFARIVTVYGRSRAKTLWGNSEEQLQIMRREWAKTIGGLSLDQLETIFDRLKEKLAASDKDYQWPDIPRMLGLLKDGKRSSAHHIFQAELPEPEWRREQRRTVGRIASATATAVLCNRACFIEDRPWIQQGSAE